MGSSQFPFVTRDGRGLVSLQGKDRPPEVPEFISWGSKGTGVGEVLANPICWLNASRPASAEVRNG